MKKEGLGYTSIIFIVCMIFALLLLIISFGEEKVLLIFLPLIYFVLFVIFAKVYKYINHPGMFVLNVIAVIRYVIIPFLIIIYPEYIDKYGNVMQGVRFMIYEELCLGIFLIFITKRYYKDRKEQQYLEISRNNNIFLKLLVIYSIIIVIADPKVLLQYNFVFSNVNNIELINKRTLIKGINGMVFDWGKLLLPLLISIIFIKKYRKKNYNIYFYFVVIVITCLNILIFSGTSRNSVIMPAVGSMFFLIKAFPNKKKLIYISLSLLIVIVVIQLTILKTKYIGSNTPSSLGSVIDYLESYFGGPTNMGIAVTAKETYSGMFSINTLLNDLFGNFPFLSHNFNLEDRTSTLYNLVFYNGGIGEDQIIPSFGQGLFYFGYLFSFIPEMLIVLGMAKFDSAFRNSRDLTGIYFTSYFAARFGFTYIQNISITLSFIYSMIIPMLIILFINRKINKINWRSMDYAKNKDFICYK